MSSFLYPDSATRKAFGRQGEWLRRPHRRKVVNPSSSAVKSSTPKSHNRVLLFVGRMINSVVKLFGRKYKQAV